MCLLEAKMLDAFARNCTGCQNLHWLDIWNYKCNKFDIRFQPSHVFLSDGETKLSWNISFETCSPVSQNPTSFATTSALSRAFCMLRGSDQSLFTSCNRLFCFPSGGMSHFMYSISLSSAFSFELTLLARYSLSCFSALILYIQKPRVGKNY